MKRRFGGVVPNTAFSGLGAAFTLCTAYMCSFTGSIALAVAFQAGALLAIGIVLARLIMGNRRNAV